MLHLTWRPGTESSRTSASRGQWPGQGANIEWSTALVPDLVCSMQLERQQLVLHLYDQCSDLACMRVLTCSACHSARRSTLQRVCMDGCFGAMHAGWCCCLACGGCIPSIGLHAEICVSYTIELRPSPLGIPGWACACG